MFVGVGSAIEIITTDGVSQHQMIMAIQLGSIEVLIRYIRKRKRGESRIKEGVLYISFYKYEYPLLIFIKKRDLLYKYILLY